MLRPFAPQSLVCIARAIGTRSATAQIRSSASDKLREIVSAQIGESEKNATQPRVELATFAAPVALALGDGAPPALRAERACAAAARKNRPGKFEKMTNNRSINRCRNTVTQIRPARVKDACSCVISTCFPAEGAKSRAGCPSSGASVGWDGYDSETCTCHRA